MSRHSPQLKVGSKLPHIPALDTPYAANDNHIAYMIGYTARVHEIHRRCNQFAINTESHAQWDHGWLAAHIKALEDIPEKQDLREVNLLAKVKTFPSS